MAREEVRACRSASVRQQKGDAMPPKGAASVSLKRPERRMVPAQITLIREVDAKALMSRSVRK